MNTQTSYITTSIPYVNAAPHVGHALELVQADAIARSCRLLGRKTRFQTGTDENALKNVEAARARGVPVQQFVDGNAEIFRQLSAKLNTSPDTFLRTTEPRHRRSVDVFWNRLKPEDLYRKRYRGLYCTGCEDFYLERELVDGHCPDHGTLPVVVEEENIFFRLSRYQQRLEDLLSSGRIAVIPEARRNEVLAFVRRGLQDFSVSRPASRSAGWGIPVPGDPSQVIYVWIDALINYLSGLDFGSDSTSDTFWSTQCRKVHVIGKNVWKFHAVYWPALLLSAVLPVPDEIMVHGFLTVDGRKISKTLGNTVDPLALIGDHGADALRYFFLRAVPPFEDSDFSIVRFRNVYNADLANGIGNFASRVTNLAARLKLERYDASAPPAPPDGVIAAFLGYRFDEAAAILWREINTANAEIERVKPWELSAVDAKQAVLSLLRTLHRVGHWIEPLLPDASRDILTALRREPLAACPKLFPRWVVEESLARQA